MPQLAQLFLEEANTGRLKQLGGFTSDALDALASYGWPGNVDELAAVVRAAHEQAAGGEVTTSHLPRRLQLAAHAVEHGPRSDAIDLEALLARIERELIERALKRSKGNKSKAAKLLGLTRPRLYRRLVQLGLEEPSDKSSCRRDARLHQRGRVKRRAGCQSGGSLLGWPLRSPNCGSHARRS